LLGEEKLAEQITRLLTPVALAVFGGIAHGLNCKQEEFSWWFFFTGIITSAFVGICVFYVLDGVSIPQGFKSASIAISGYSSHEVLQVLKKRVLKSLAGRVERECSSGK
jgi:hypothetical protein